MSEVGSLEWTMEFAKELRTRIETADKAGYVGIFEADGRDVAMLYSEIERLREVMKNARAVLRSGNSDRALRILQLSGDSSSPETQTIPADAQVIPGRLSHADWCPAKNAPTCRCGAHERGTNAFGQPNLPRPIT